jgi:hypothetical protein
VASSGIAQCQVTALVGAGGKAKKSFFLHKDRCLSNVRAPAATTGDSVLAFLEQVVVAHTSETFTMAEIDARFVKHGLWTNLEEGNIMGKTITTDTRTGTIVIALMAILSTVGKCCILLVKDSSKIWVATRNLASLESGSFCVPSSSSYRRDSRWVFSPAASDLEDVAATQLTDG